MASELIPDVILMDCMLPEKDGLEIIKELKKYPETADIPVLAFSGNISEAFNDERILGVDKFLGRGFSAEELAIEVDTFLKK